MIQIFRTSCHQSHLQSIYCFEHKITLHLCCFYLCYKYQKKEAYFTRRYCSVLYRRDNIAQLKLHLHLLSFITIHESHLSVQFKRNLIKGLKVGASFILFSLNMTHLNATDSLFLIQHSHTRCALYLITLCLSNTILYPSSSFKSFTIISLFRILFRIHLNGEKFNEVPMYL